MEKGLLVDKEVLGLFGEENDSESIKLIIERIQDFTQKKFITKDLFFRYREQINKAFSSLPVENQKNLEQLKIKLGLSIEISKEFSSTEPETVSNFFSKVKIKSLGCSVGKKIDVGDFVNHFRGRFIEMRGFLQGHPALDNLISINKISGTKQGVSVVGLVYDKKFTKNKNFIFEVEDMTGTIKILINKDKEELLKKAEDVALDSVVGFKCSGNREILFANEIIFPETSLLNKKKAFVEEYVAFIGDIHYGSKKFMKDNFLKFIDYLNCKIPGNNEVEKIKYLIIIGDLITGVGVYPNQEKDLEIVDLEDQFTGIAELLGRIRKDIQIIIIPGNHEGVRLMEPQPIYDEKYAWALHDLNNVFLVENPSFVNIASTSDFEGFNLLLYHGFSYPYYADNVPKLMKEKVMNAPEKIMKYLLMHRHLAPTHGSVQYFPCAKDAHIIREIPDIFVSGHTHKAAVFNYNNILIVSSATWEELTPYQEKFGNIPDHCKVPILNLKTRAVKILDFE
jgi:DNA polymerase II small subunit